ncbi:hypothetical protein BY458DRAFT_447396 [Sporodiniella umbellata]|nr:hypothetical protein BY458DRAFT_447396 [Sporodiniella umbellata]
MEDNTPSTRSLTDPLNGDYVLQMDLDSTVSSLSDPKVDSTEDVCYPYVTPSEQTLDVEALERFMDTQYDFKEELTVRLDDLRDKEEYMSKKYDIYSEHDPLKMSQEAIRYTFYSPDLGTFEHPSLWQLFHFMPHKRSVAELLVDSNNWWIDICSPTNEEMKNISKHYMFVSFRTFNQDINSPNYLNAINFYIVVFKEGVLTFRFHELSHPQNVRRRIHQLKDFIKVTPEWINYALIDNITDGFAPLIQHTEIEVDSIDDLVLVLSGSEQNDMLRRIGSCRKAVMQLLRLLGPKADVLRSLIKRYADRAKEMEQLMRSQETPLTTEADEVKAHHEVTLYLGDIQDHIITMLQNVNHYDLTLGRAHRNYLGQITIELSQAGNTTNEVINRLTFFGSIIIPLNLIGSLFGMNVHVPGQGESDLVWFYWIVLGMVIYLVSALAIGKRIGFL